MRKLTTNLALWAVLGTLSTSAHAIENNYRPYVGLNYAYDNAVVKQIRPHYNSASVTLGSVYNRYFDTELFYQYSGKDKLGYQAIKNTSFNAYGLDMLAYLPLGCEGHIAPLVTTGIGQYTFKHKMTDHSHINDHGWGYRFGAGLQYNIDENWAVRAVYRYINTNKIDNYDHVNEYSVGVRYTF